MRVEPEPNATVLRIHLDAAYGCTFDRCWPDLCSVQFLFAGSMFFGRDDSPVHTLKAPALYWILPEYRYRLGAVGKGDVRHYSIFGLDTCALVRAFDAISPDGCCELNRIAPFDHHFRELHRCLQRPSVYSGVDAALRLRLMLVEALTQCAAGKPTDSSRQNDIEKAAAAIARAPFKDWDLQQTARELGVSYSHFRRLFREFMRRSPYDYVLHWRMLAAADMLLDSGRTVSEVASEAGYDDPAQFSRRFKQSFGVTPSQYRGISSP